MNKWRAKELVGLILYTPMPLEAVMASEQDYMPKYREIQYKGVTVLVEPQCSGIGKIFQVKSTDPYVYLKEELQPGKEIVF